ncbi:hypothetical protein BCV71DRAFT_286015 [Rhizopus microsporus]|uniref:MULE transposase domain-containing protein n=1 Tax=Rhizopus microsporus TaxID=58291 RepID=A0A1X0S1T0_RHIZD|nr:hypothetical protein BCV71DRAFT_286015 [Rhizopus microsporus]
MSLICSRKSHKDFKEYTSNVGCCVYILLPIVQWLIPRYTKEPVERTDEESSSGPNKQFKCHRFGTCRDRVAEGVRVKGDSSGKPRELQKASKKTDCKAKLKATCLKSDPNFVEIVHIDVHNHEIGGAEDLKEKGNQMQRLREGCSKRNCRIAIQKDFRKFTRDFLMLPEDSSSQIVHQDEVYNLYKMVQESFYRKAVDEKESVGLWLEELKGKNYTTFKHSNFENDFTFGFSSPWQKQLLLNSIMIRVDVSTTEHAAITAVYPEAAVQWCLFHVSRTWMGKIRELIKLESLALNNQVHRAIITDLKALMWKKNRVTFLLSLLAFNMKYSMHTSFLSYMERNYLSREKFVHWSAAFQPQIFFKHGDKQTSSKAGIAN